MARPAGYAKYPAQVTFSTSEAEREAIDAEAAARGVSVSQVVRELIARGRKK